MRGESSRALEQVLPIPGVHKFEITIDTGLSQLQVPEIPRRVANALQAGLGSG
jgi:hypothetical protein